MRTGGKIAHMAKLRMKESATLTQIYPLRVDDQTKEDAAVLNAKKFDLAGTMRAHLLREIRKAKKHLGIA